MGGIKDRIDGPLAAVLRESMRIVLVWIPLAFGAASIPYVGYVGLKSFGPDSIKYRLQYDVDSDHVYISDKPHDCEWDTAPMGNKLCHYEKSVSVIREDLKPWELYAGKKAKVNSVFVTWNKVKDN
jgi:hypothetical protein